jgi:hypothetical protein
MTVTRYPGSMATYDLRIGGAGIEVGTCAGTGVAN